jgi:hypothetical protein
MPPQVAASKGSEAASAASARANMLKVFKRQGSDMGNKLTPPDTPKPSSDGMAEVSLSNQVNSESENDEMEASDDNQKNDTAGVAVNGHANGNEEMRAKSDGASHNSSPDPTRPEESETKAPTAPAPDTNTATRVGSTGLDERPNNEQRGAPATNLTVSVESVDYGEPIEVHTCVRTMRLRTTLGKHLFHPHPGNEWPPNLPEPPKKYVVISSRDGKTWDDVKRLEYEAKSGTRLNAGVLDAVIKAITVTNKKGVTGVQMEDVKSLRAGLVLRSSTAEDEYRVGKGILISFNTSSKPSDRLWWVDGFTGHDSVSISWGLTVRSHELTKLPVWKPTKSCTKHHVSTFLETMKTMGWKCSDYTEEEMLAIARSTAETSDASQSKGKLTAPTPATKKAAAEKAAAEKAATKKAAAEKAAAEKAAAEKAAAEKAAEEKAAEEKAAEEKKKAEEMAAEEKAAAEKAAKKAAEEKAAEEKAIKERATEKMAEKKAEEMAAAEKKAAEKAAKKAAAEKAAKKVAADNVAASTVTPVVEDQQMPVEETVDPSATSTKRARESEDVDQEEESAVTMRLMAIYKEKTEKLVQEMTDLEEQKSTLDKTLARVHSKILHLNSLSRSLAVSLDAASSKRQKQ